MKLPKPCSDRIRTTRRAALFLSAALVLSACDDPRVLDDLEGGPPSSTSDELAVEGLTWLVVGDRLMAAGEYEAALKAYYRAGAQEGLSANVLSAIGSAQAQLGRLGQAERTLRSALELDERSVPVWNNLGIVLYSRGETGEARDVFKTAFALDNGASPEIRENLNFVNAKLQNVVVEEPLPTEFRLVRRGNGRYLLLGNN